MGVKSWFGPGTGNLIYFSLHSVMPANQSEDNSPTPGSSLEPVPVPVPTTPVKSHVTDLDPELSPNEVSSGELAVLQISQATLPVPAVKIEPLAIIPVVRKPRQIETLGQRRMRRPFSVSEVEALVAAVEKLGTGRYQITTTIISTASIMFVNNLLIRRKCLMLDFLF